MDAQLNMLMHNKRIREFNYFGIVISVITKGKHASVNIFESVLRKASVPIQLHNWTHDAGEHR